MKTLKEFKELNESTPQVIAKWIHKKEFDGGEEAQDYLEAIRNAAHAPVLAQFMKLTDDNHGSKTLAQLKVVNKAINKLINDFFKSTD